MLRDEVANYKSRGGETVTVTCTCPYCGQMMAISVTPDIQQNEAKMKELAIESCNCPEAQIRAGRKERMERMIIVLDNSIGAKSERPLEDDVLEAITTIARAICFSELEKAIVHVEKKEKITIKRDSKGYLKIERERKVINTSTV